MEGEECVFQKNSAYSFLCGKSSERIQDIVSYISLVHGLIDWLKQKVIETEESGHNLEKYVHMEQFSQGYEQCFSYSKEKYGKK